MGLTGDADLRAFLTVEEAAALLGLKRSTAYELARRGQLPCFRVGRFVRVPRDALLNRAERTEAGGGRAVAGLGPGVLPGGRLAAPAPVRQLPVLRPRAAGRDQGAVPRPPPRRKSQGLPARKPLGRLKNWSRWRESNPQPTHYELEKWPVCILFQFESRCGCWILRGVTWSGGYTLGLFCRRLLPNCSQRRGFCCASHPDSSRPASVCKLHHPA
jgi:excisionase family DNA binding protein